MRRLLVWTLVVQQTVDAQAGGVGEVLAAVGARKGVWLRVQLHVVLAMLLHLGGSTSGFGDFRSPAALP